MSPGRVARKFSLNMEKEYEQTNANKEMSVSERRCECLQHLITGEKKHSVRWPYNRPKKGALTSTVREELPDLSPYVD